MSPLRHFHTLSHSTGEGLSPFVADGARTSLLLHLVGDRVLTILPHNVVGGEVPALYTRRVCPPRLADRVDPLGYAHESLSGVWTLCGLPPPTMARRQPTVVEIVPNGCDGGRLLIDYIGELEHRGFQ